MTQRVKVLTNEPDGSARVMLVRESACSGDCHKCTGCGAAKETLILSARNPIGALPGELVEITSESGPVLAAAAMLYMVPLMLFFLGYIAGDMLWAMGALCGCAAFVLGIALAVIYDRKVVKKQNTVYTITGRVGKSSGQS